MKNNQLGQCIYIFRLDQLAHHYNIITSTAPMYYLKKFAKRIKQTQNLSLGDEIVIVTTIIITVALIVLNIISTGQLYLNTIYRSDTHDMATGRSLSPDRKTIGYVDFAFPLTENFDKKADIGCYGTIGWNNISPGCVLFGIVNILILIIIGGIVLAVIFVAGYVSWRILHHLCGCCATAIDVYNEETVLVEVKTDN